MLSGKKILAIIPAKGISKGLSGKNTKYLCGKPLIAWTIEHALKVESIDTLICSTEDTKVAEIARSYGCEVPFLRPASLSLDHVKVDDVALDVLYKLEQEGSDYDIIMLLHCTSPLRSNVDILNALELFVSQNMKTLIGVCEMECPVHWALYLSNDNIIETVLNQDSKIAQRQTLPKAYRPNGALYISTTDNLKEHNNFMVPDSYGFIMERNHSVDIDNEEDFKYAEYLINSREVVDGK